MFSLSKPWAVAWLSNSEWALLLFGIVLVWGLVGEYFADHKKKEYPRFKKHKRLFELLVIVGVAGELFADGGIFVFSARLQTISDAEVSTSNERAGNAEKDAKYAGFFAARIGITKTQLSLQVEILHVTNLAFASTVETLRSNNLVTDKRLTDEANVANLRAASLESSNFNLSLTVENLHSNNLITEKQVEDLRKENLQLETRMITGLYARSHFEIFPMDDLKRVSVLRTGWDTRVFILLPSAPVSVSINAILTWHPGFVRGLAGLMVGSEFGKSEPIVFGNNKNVLFTSLGIAEWNRLEYPQNAKFIIRYTELEQETNLWKKLEIKGKDVYFDDVKQKF